MVRTSVIRAVFLLLCAPIAFIPAQESLGLALAGGGALGFAHLGVISVLEEVGLDPHYISGTSIGSIIGSLYAAGYSSAEIIEIVTGIDWNELLTDVPPRSRLTYDEKEANRRYRIVTAFVDGRPIDAVGGLIAGQHLVELLDRLLEAYATEDDFSQLPRSIAIVAADLVTGEEVVFTSGDLKSAIRASIAVPGVFSPLYYDGRYLIDGGWVNRLPVDAVIDLGARTTIAVNLTVMEQSAVELQEISSIVERSETILRLASIAANIESADIVITPDLRGYTMADFGKASELVELGRQAAYRRWDELVALREELASEPTVRPIEQRSGRTDLDGRSTLGINEVSLAVPWDRAVPEELEQLRRRLSGLRVSREELRREVYALYDTGLYDYVSYDLVGRTESDERYDLVLYAVPALEKTSELRVGVGAHTFFDGESNTRFILTSAFVSTLHTERVLLSADFWLSDVPQAFVSLAVTPVDPVRFKIGAYAFSPPLLVYDGRTVESLYLQHRIGAGIGFEAPFFRRFLLDVTGFVEQFQLDRFQGARVYDEIDAIRYGVSAEARYDTLDRALFPTRGSEQLFAYRWRYDDDDQSLNARFDVTGRWFIPFGRRVNLQLRVEGGTDFDSRLPVYERYYTGGPEIFEGYYFQELSGNHIVATGLDLRIALFRLPLALGERGYLRLGTNVARVWTEDFGDVFSVDTVAGGRIALGFNTILGELNIGFALNDEFRPLGYLILGPAYTATGTGYDW